MSSTDNGTFIGHAPHVECGSSDGLALYDKGDTTEGYCFACSQWVPGEVSTRAREKLGNLVFKAKTPEELIAEVVAVYNTHAVRALTDRDISIDTTAYFDVRVGVSQQDGVSVAEHYYPYYADGVLKAYKKRVVASKMFYWVGDKKGTELFGQYQARATGSKRLIITEGECDAMAAYQMLRDADRGTEWEKYLPAVVSISCGAATAVTELAAQLAFLNQFDEIVLCFDGDEPGQLAVKDCAALMPSKIKVATLSEKDANDMLRKGKHAEFKRAVVFKADVPKPSGVIRIADVFDSARKKAEWVLPWPWPTLTRLTFGRRRGELIGVGAGVGVGKTNFWHQLIEQVACVDQSKIGVFMLEEAPAMTAKMIAGKFAGVQFHDPSATYPQEVLDEALRLIEDKVVLFRHEGAKDWEEIKQAIRFMVLAEGCKDIIIDPLSALTYHVDSSQANDLLNEIMGDLASLVQQLSFTCYYSSHLNPPQTGAPHEEGGRVKEHQFTGSRAMIKWSNYIIGLERNKQADDETVRNTTTCRLLKDREHGNAGTFAIYYDKQTGKYLEPNYEAPAGVTY